jgi:endoplasmic reticulum resident protein 44
MLNGKIYKKEYRGNRGADAMVKYIRKVLTDPVQHVQTIDAYNRIDESKAAIIAYMSDNSQSTSEYQMYRKVATDLRDDCNFIWVTGDPISVYASKNNLINKVVFKPPRSKVNEKDMEYPGGLHSYNELSTWTTNKCIPLVREITFENAEELTEEGLPFMILFYHPDDKGSIEQYRNIVHHDLYSESSGINFLIADGKKFAHPLHHLGKTAKDLPLIAIDSFRHMYMFPNFAEVQ